MTRGLYNFDEIHIDYYRDASSMFEAFKAGLYDFRIEDDPTRWRDGYDFPAVRDGRILKQSIPYSLPKGISGFAFNTRRPIFADPRVREGLAMMFDFEWINANLYAGVYTRSRSFFDDSELSSAGRPASPAERALLAPFPGAVREDILEGRWSPPVHDGSGRDRDLARGRPRSPRQGGLCAARRRADERARRRRSLSKSSSSRARRNGSRSPIRAAWRASASRPRCASSTRCSFSAGAGASIST